MENGNSKIRKILHFLGNIQTPQTKAMQESWFALIDELFDKQENFMKLRKLKQSVDIQLIVEFNPTVPICEDIEEYYFYFKDENHDVCRVKMDEYIKFIIDGIGEMK